MMCNGKWPNLIDGTTHLLSLSVGHVGVAEAWSCVHTVKNGALI